MYCPSWSSETAGFLRQRLVADFVALAWDPPSAVLFARALKQLRKKNGGMLRKRSTHLGVISSCGICKPQTAAAAKYLVNVVVANGFTAHGAKAQIFTLYFPAKMSSAIWAILKKSPVSPISRKEYRVCVDE